MGDRSNKSERKCMRKQKRAQHRLERDMDVESSELPTQVMNYLKTNFDNYLYLPSYF